MGAASYSVISANIPNRSVPCAVIASTIPIGQRLHPDLTLAQGDDDVDEVGHWLWVWVASRMTAFRSPVRAWMARCRAAPVPRPSSA
jgi:hypothetical protein